MAVKIKLMRMGKIRAPYYRIVVADARTKRDGRAIEEIGKYHPTEEPSRIEVDSARAQYWLGVGAQPTEPVQAILRVTGDWQRFKGEAGAEGTLRRPAPKADKKSTFEEAARESLGQAKDGATTPRKKALRPPSDDSAVATAAAAAEGTPSAARPTADEAAAAGDVRAAGSGELAGAPAGDAPAAGPDETPAAVPTDASAAADASGDGAAVADAPAEGDAKTEA